LPAASPEDDRDARINMPVSGSPFSRLANNRKLTDEKLVRAIRFMVAAAFEATQLYSQLVESTDIKLTVKVLEDMANKERVHVGQFLRSASLPPMKESSIPKGQQK